MSCSKISVYYNLLCDIAGLFSEELQELKILVNTVQEAGNLLSLLTSLG